MVGTGKLFRVLWCKCHDIWFLVHLTINIFIFDFGLLQAKMHFLQNRQENAVTWCILVTKYLMRDMMDYHCLRVFRSRVRRIGKHSPSFLCSEPECMAVPMLSRAVFRSRAPSWRSFLLTINLSCQTSYLRGLRIPCYRWRCLQ